MSPAHQGGHPGEWRDPGVEPPRALAKEVEIGHPEPTRWYRGVAEVLSLVYKLRKKTG